MPDPTPKGPRHRRNLRMPLAHDRVYQAKADQLGMDYNTYVAWCLAKLHGLQWPPPINEDQEKIPRIDVAA